MTFAAATKLGNTPVPRKPAATTPMVISAHPSSDRVEVRICEFGRLSNRRHRALFQSRVGRAARLRRNEGKQARNIGSVNGASHTATSPTIRPSATAASTYAIALCVSQRYVARTYIGPSITGMCSSSDNDAQWSSVSSSTSAEVARLMTTDKLGIEQRFSMT
jgi:hypothetical protein